MDPKQDYSINLNLEYDPLQLIDVSSVAARMRGDWANQTLCQVNDCVVRLGVFQKGEFHWHQHDKEDEFFFVLDGQFIIDLEGETVTLQRHQGYTVPRGVVHRTRVAEPTTILMVEAATVVPTGD